MNQQSMKNEYKINSDTINIIIKLCFCVNELKELYDTEKNILSYFKTYEDIKDRIDRIIRAVSIKSMLKSIGESKAFSKNSLNIYKIIPIDFENKTQIIGVLYNICALLTELDGQINQF